MVRRSGDQMEFWLSNKKEVVNRSNGQVVTGPKIRSRGALLIRADWQVRVFGLSGLVDRLSECMSVRTIPLYR